MKLPKGSLGVGCQRPSAEATKTTCAPRAQACGPARARVLTEVCKQAVVGFRFRLLTGGAPAQGPDHVAAAPIHSSRNMSARVEW
jgi:hypothetical protein